VKEKTTGGKGPKSNSTNAQDAGGKRSKRDKRTSSSKAHAASRGGKWDRKTWKAVGTGEAGKKGDVWVSCRVCGGKDFEVT